MDLEWGVLIQRYISTGNAEFLEAAGARHEVFSRRGGPKGEVAEGFHIWVLGGRLNIYSE